MLLAKQDALTSTCGRPLAAGPALTLTPYPLLLSGQERRQGHSTASPLSISTSPPPHLVFISHDSGLQHPPQPRRMGAVAHSMDMDMDPSRLHPPPTADAAPGLQEGGQAASGPTAASVGTAPRCAGTRAFASGPRAAPSPPSAASAPWVAWTTTSPCRPTGASSSPSVVPARASSGHPFACRSSDLVRVDRHLGHGRRHRIDRVARSIFQDGQMEQPPPTPRAALSTDGRSRVRPPSGRSSKQGEAAIPTTAPRSTTEHKPRGDANVRLLASLVVVPSPLCLGTLTRTRHGNGGSMRDRICTRTRPRKHTHAHLPERNMEAMRIYVCAEVRAACSVAQAASATHRLGVRRLACSRTRFCGFLRCADRSQNRPARGGEVPTPSPRRPSDPRHAVPAGQPCMHISAVETHAPGGNQHRSVPVEVRLPLMWKGWHSDSVSSRGP
ncbi:hypothetical protein DCS_05094 [Drechmeria coniospora]|uniref:Uncharacterized protein n=1 Tax=Drechmeria coniospora TaxID=98403 RepID=A0A151GM31_DRECN|nr:hypothetical protein DCS_05094 [Drechmeria coniospora]KYK58081.1 hypothetical protein DCS_05094 [Drechmeria coniospora]